MIWEVKKMPKKEIKIEKVDDKNYKIIIIDEGEEKLQVNISGIDAEKLINNIANIQAKKEGEIGDPNQEGINIICNFLGCPSSTGN